MNKYTEKGNDSKEKTLKPRIPIDLAILYTYHSIFFMIIAEHWEATPVSEGSYLPKSFVVNRFGHHNNRRVRGTDSKFLIDIA